MATKEINNIIDSLHTGQVVRARFTENDKRVYTYKVPAVFHVNEGDLVLVRVPDGTIKEVLVTEVGDATLMPIDVTYKHKFILGPSSFPEHDAAIDEERRLQYQVETIHRAKIRDALIKELGLTMADFTPPPA